ncbi:MAG: hypothetical protein M3Y08_13835 [Fibrobacterota bacterium]|nr:hypothetical protein [Fibrobacterota bacterium]
MDIPTLDTATLSLIVLVAAVIGMLMWGVAAADKRAGAEGGSRFQSRWALIAAAVVTAWMAYSGLAAGMGLFLDPESIPPPFLRLMGPGLLLVFFAAFSGFGKRLAKHLGYAALIGFHGFRLPLEGLLWWFHKQGRLPVQMTFEGRNLDILTGISAIVMAVLVQKGMAGRKAIMIWNLTGFILLINIMTVAILSIPGPMRRFHNEPANTLVLHFPYVWIPAIFVLSAFLGHLLILRKLRLTA